MKRIIAMLLAMIMVFSLAACGMTPAADDSNVNPDGTVGDGTADDNNTVEPDDVVNDEEVPVEGDIISDIDRLNATNILEDIWNKFPEDMKPMSFGGETESEDFVENAPANHPVGDGSKLFNDFGFPTEMTGKIEEAGTIRHMMNVNSFTCGAYYVTNIDDVQAICDGIDDALMHRSYLCGAPQQLVIMVVYDRYVVNVFGAEDLVNAFKETASEVYGDKLNIVYDHGMEDAHGENGLDMGNLGIALG